MNRRSFLKNTGVAALCTISGSWGGSGCASACISNVPAAPEAGYVKEGDRIVLSLRDVAELKPVGGAVRLLLDESGDSRSEILVAHVGENDYRAYPNQCTHKGKEIDYYPDEGILRCCSGHSDFELSGEVIEGNATEALQLYAVQLEGNELIVLL